MCVGVPPDGRVGPASILSRPSVSGRTGWDGVGGREEPRMVPRGECHQKEASGTRAREGIQDNLKPDSQENRPALSLLTSTPAIPSTSFHSRGAGVQMTLDYR